jgi:hypothetical protein
MKSNWTWAGVASFCAALLMGCGGGGGEAGGPEAMALSVSNLTFEYPEGNVSCTPATTGVGSQWINVLIFGGKGVFRVESTVDGYFEVDRTELQSRRFRFKHLGGCTTSAGLENALIVLDSNNQQANIKFVAMPKQVVTP